MERNTEEAKVALTCRSAADRKLSPYPRTTSLSGEIQRGVIHIRQNIRSSITIS